MPKPGWLKRQIERAQAEIASWPDWMKREMTRDKLCGMELDEYIQEMGGFGEFTARPIYSPEGDFLIHFWENRRTFARWINQNLSLYISFQDEKIVGVKISNLQDILKAFEKENELTDTSQERRPFRYEDLQHYLSSVEYGEFKPYPYYNVESDTLTYYWSNEQDYGDYINETLMVMRNVDSNSPVGVQISGVKKLVDGVK